MSGEMARDRFLGPANHQNRRVLADLHKVPHRVPLSERSRGRVSTVRVSRSPSRLRECWVCQDLVMKFRELNAVDLIPGSWMDEALIRPDLWRDQHTRSAAAVEHDAVVAVGSIWTSRANATRYWIDIAVDPAYRRRGIGTGLARHLATLRLNELPFKTRGFVDEPRMRFADALGARTIQIVPPAIIATDSRIVLRPRPEVRDARSVEWLALLEANAHVYEWTHAIWSPVADGFAETVNEGLQDDLDLEATSVAIDGEGRIRALAMAYTDTDPPLVTAEATEPDNDEGERLVEGCVRATLDVFAARGVDTVQFDGHVSDPHFLPVWARLTPTGTWFRIVEIFPS